MREGSSPPSRSNIHLCDGMISSDNQLDSGKICKVRPGSSQTVCHCLLASGNMQCTQTYMSPADGLCIDVTWLTTEARGTSRLLGWMATFSSMLPVVMNLYTYTCFFWPSRHTLAAACLSVAGFQSAEWGTDCLCVYLVIVLAEKCAAKQCLVDRKVGIWLMISTLKHNWEQQWTR